MKFDGIEKQVLPANCEKNVNDVTIYQHLPNGRVREKFAPVGKEYVEMSEGLMFECELLSAGVLALYVHWPDEENYGCELAKNEPGNDEPIQMLREMIKRKVANDLTSE